MDCARRRRAVRIAGQRDTVRLVQHHPVLDPVAEPARHLLRVVGQPVRDVAIAKIAGPHRDVPVKQRQVGREVPLQHRVDHAIVGGEARFARRAGAVRLHARPRGGEPECLDARVREQREIARVAFLEFDAARIRRAVGDRAGLVGEHVPVAAPAAVAAFDLRRGGGDAPHEVVGEAGRGVGVDRIAAAGGQHAAAEHGGALRQKSSAALKRDGFDHGLTRFEANGIRVLIRIAIKEARGAAKCTRAGSMRPALDVRGRHMG